MKINKKLAIIFFLFVVVLINYINIFPNEFAWDDEFFIVDNIHIGDLKNIPGFFGEPSPGNLYRPLRSVFYTITYQIWHLNAFGYHLNSLILHFLVTILIFFITLRITNKTTFSFIVSLFFAAHPVHTARITNMTASFDVVGILFMLSSLFFYILFFQNKKTDYWIFSVIFYILAIFSTEEAITLILILFLYDISFNYKINLNNIKLLFKKYIPYIVVTLFYLIVRFSVLHQIGREKVYFEHSFFGTLLTTVKVFVEYIFLLLFPFNLTIEHVVKFQTSLLSAGFVISFFILLVILFFFIKSYKMSEFSKKISEHAQKPKVSDKSKIVFFSIGFFFITLLPFSNIFPQITIMADRYLYLPSWGFCLFLAFLIFRVNRINILKKYSKTIILALIILITTTYTFMTIQRNAEWKDDFVLLSSTVEKNPLGTKTNNALAIYYRKNGYYDNALIYATRAIELSDKNYHAYENLGTINAHLKNYGKAISYYGKSLELNPDFYQGLNNLGLVYSYINDFNNSIFYLKKAIELNPKLSKGHHDIATVYAQIEEFELAEEEFKKAIEINPYDETYKENYESFQNFFKNNLS